MTKAIPHLPQPLTRCRFPALQPHNRSQSPFLINQPTILKCSTGLNSLDAIALTPHGCSLAKNRPSR